MAKKRTFKEFEVETAQKAKEIFLNQAVATLVILALIIWVAVLFRSYIAIGFLVLIVIITYSIFIPKKKFRK